MAAILGTGPAFPGSSIDNLMDMSLESLMEVKVTTVSKTPESLAHTAASVYVITREEIRRSGATTLPDALRLAPGLEIARIDSNKAVTAIRGFNSAGSSNKLLVMIDGRVVYTALLSGVFWDHLDIVMADIDRIEVVRGPGATMWGANAVNGIINIITRNTTDTQGGFLEAISGTDPVGNQATIRYGGNMPANGHYRIYGKHVQRGEFRTQGGMPFGDDRTTTQIGARMGWGLNETNRLTLQGDAYDGEFGQTIIEQPVTVDPETFELQSGLLYDRGDIGGGNILLRWDRGTTTSTDSSLQVYYDRFEREDLVGSHTTDIWDIDYQGNIPISDRLNFLWGINYRHTEYDFQEVSHVSLDPLSGKIDTYGGFIQGEYDLNDRFGFSLGTKLEHNDFTGFEYQPSIRAHWNVSPEHTIWGAASRAVRTPALFDVFGRIDLFAINSEPPLLFSAFGNTDLSAETLLAYETGYRGQVNPDLSLDISLFYNDYDDLISFESDAEPTFEPPNILFGFDADNRIEGHSYGLDASADWRISDFLRVKAGYSLTRTHLNAETGSLDTFTAPSIEISSPQQQFQLRSYMDLPHNLEFDISAYWVDRLAGNSALLLNPVDDYTRLDVHLGWKPIPNLSFDIFGQNLLEGQHQEYRDGIALHGDAPRAVFGRVRWRW